MSTIQSIIIFNGGSGGDFLRTVCLEQICGFNRYQINNQGMVFSFITDNYFKEFCKTEQRTTQQQIINTNQCFKVENAHSYHPWFQTLTPNLFYIHYDDAVTSLIVQTFIRKRSEHDFDHWVKQTMPTHVPDKLVNKINRENFTDVLSIFWKKNMQQWRTNPLLTPILIQDLFEISALTKWIERLCGQPLKDPTQLANTHQAWLNKNSILLTTLTQILS